jgi:hypothetical protein
MTPEDQKELLSGISQFVREEIAKATAPLRERIVDLQKGLEDFGYVGTWHEGSVYRRGNFVSLAGSMWSCCAEATTERPSTSSRDWILAVKRGRDGKSAGPRAADAE